MSFKSFLAESVILEGGAAIKGSEPLTQAEAREITAHVVRDLKRILKIESSQIAPVGSAGLKAPDQLSGDIDIAVVADVTLVKSAVESMALDGRFRHMPGLNVYSFAKLHGSKVAQVDIIPTNNIKLVKWAYYNDPGDLKLGLKGSHRNELLFAIAKYAEYVSKAKDEHGEDSARERLVFDLSRGLYRFVQDRAGKKGLVKSFATRDKVLLTSDPDKICARLFGDGVTAKQVMTFEDALKLMLSPSFKHKKMLPQILKRAVEGLEGKKLVVPHELRAQVVKEDLQTLDRRVMLEFQRAAIEYKLPIEGDDLDTSMFIGKDKISTLMIDFPPHYHYGIKVRFITNSTGVSRIGSAIRAEASCFDKNIDGDGDSGPLVYILLQHAKGGVEVFIDGGILGNGEDSQECKNWEEAIAFFFKDISLRLAEIKDEALSRKNELTEATDPLRLMALDLQRGVIEVLDKDGDMTRNSKGHIEVEINKHLKFVVKDSKPVHSGPTALCVIDRVIDFAQLSSVSKTIYDYYREDNGQLREWFVLAAFNNADQAIEWVDTWMDDILKAWVKVKSPEDQP